MPGEEAMGDQF